MSTSSQMPPVQCASWCRDGNGHTNAAMAADQVCYSEPAHTRLSIPQPAADRDWTGDHKAYVALSLHHDVPDAEPVVETGLNDDSGILLTVDEAEQYARSIWREIAVVAPSLAADFYPDSASEQEKLIYDSAYERGWHQRLDPDSMDLDDVIDTMRVLVGVLERIDPGGGATYTGRTIPPVEGLHDSEADQ